MKMRRKGSVLRELVCVLCVLVLASGGLLLSGCVEQAVWSASSMVAMNEVVNDSQERFLDAVNTLNTETNRINTAVDNIETSINDNIEVMTIKPETREAFDRLKGRERDPVAWVAVGSIIANAIMGGRASVKTNTG